MSAAVAERWNAPDLATVSGFAAGGPSVEALGEIEAAARAEGYAAGHSEGHATGLGQAQGEVRRLTAQIEGLLESFARPLGQLDAEIERVLAELAIQVAGVLLGRAYEAEPELLAELVAEAVRMTGPATREVEVRLHPDDLVAVNQLLHTLPAGTRLQRDENLGRGDVRVHAEALRLDASVAARLQSALAALVERREGTPQDPLP